MNITDTKQFIDRLPEGILVVGANGKIITINSRAAQLLNMPAQSLENQLLSKICHDSHEKIEKQLKLCAKTTNTMPIALKLISTDYTFTDGHLFKKTSKQGTAIVFLRIGLRKTTDNPFVSLNEQITESKKSNRLLQQNQRKLQQELELRIEAETNITALNKQLEQNIIELKQTHKSLSQAEKMAALGQLVSGIAHEVNTPVGVCLMGVSQIQEQIGIVLNKIENNKLDKNTLMTCLSNSQSLTHSMFNSLNKLTELIDIFKQVSAQHHCETKKTFNLNEHCQLVLASLNSKIKENNVTISNNIEQSITINSYASIFSQMLSNFINNSLIHGIQSGGTIELSAFYCNDYLNFNYSDNGKGIEHSIIDKIFDPFFTTTMGQGSGGLGLSIVHNLVTHKLNGVIQCSSEVSNGVRMLVKVPRSEVSFL